MASLIHGRAPPSCQMWVLSCWALWVGKFRSHCCIWSECLSACFIPGPFIPPTEGEAPSSVIFFRSHAHSLEKSQSFFLRLTTWQPLSLDEAGSEVCTRWDVRRDAASLGCWPPSASAPLLLLSSLRRCHSGTDLPWRSGTKVSSAQRSEN